MTYLVVTAIAIIVALAGYAGWLHYRLWKLRRQTIKGAEADKHDTDNRVVEVRKSIYLIADALLDDKLTTTEACLRICALANHLSEVDSFRMQYGVLFRVAEATAHIPILDQWQALDVESKKVFDRQRLDIESRYQDAVLESISLIKTEFSTHSS